MDVAPFLNYLKNVKRYSLHTIVAYKVDLDQFMAFCATKKDVFGFSDISSKVVREWVVVKMSEGVSAVSMKRKISALRALFNYLLREGKIEEDPSEILVMPRVGKRSPVFVPEYQMDELLDNMGLQGGFSGLRDRLVILMAYYTGMRRAELVRLKVKDVDFASQSLVLTGKGNKQRMVPLAEELTKEMKAYMALRERLVEGKHDVFFVTDRGDAVYDKYIYRLVVKWLGRVTTMKKKSPHVLRHTFATHLLNNGACIEAIRELLGHSDLSATQVYTHNSFENLIKVFNQAHPRAEK